MAISIELEQWLRQDCSAYSLLLIGLVTPGEEDLVMLHIPRPCYLSEHNSAVLLCFAHNKDVITSLEVIRQPYVILPFVLAGRSELS